MNILVLYDGCALTLYTVHVSSCPYASDMTSILNTDPILMITLATCWMLSSDYQEPLPERSDCHKDGQLPSDTRPSGP